MRTIGNILVETVGFPVVVLRFVGTIDAPMYTELGEFQRELIEAQRPYCMISDLRLMSFPSSHARLRAAEVTRELAPLAAQISCGSIVWVTSPLVRGGITAFRWLAPTRTPESVVNTGVEVSATARAMLAARGVRVAEAAQAVLEKLEGES